jgi:hypothetical protein
MARQVLNNGDLYSQIRNKTNSNFEEVYAPVTLSTSSTDDATSVTAAPLKSAGGLGVAKDARVGGRLWLSGDNANVFLAYGNTTRVFRFASTSFTSADRVKVRISNLTGANVYIITIDVAYRGAGTVSGHFASKKIAFVLDVTNFANVVEATILESGVGIAGNITVVHTGADRAFDFIINGIDGSAHNSMAYTATVQTSRYVPTVEAPIQEVKP